MIGSEREQFLYDAFAPHDVECAESQMPAESHNHSPQRGACGRLDQPRAAREAKDFLSHHPRRCGIHEKRRGLLVGQFRTDGNHAIRR
jgi:hypothetical protein